MTALQLPRKLDGNFREIERLHPTADSISERLTPPNTASITLPPEESIPFRGWVELYTPDGSAGIYRAISTSTDCIAEGRYDLEHGIVTLEDDVLTGEGEITGTVREIAEQILARQTVRHWVLGQCDNGESLTYEYNSTKLLAALLEVYGDEKQYALSYDMSAHPWTVNIVRLSSTVQAEGRITRNLRSVRISYDENDLCTRVYCDKLEGEKYVTGPTADKWGIITREVKANEGVDQASLRQYITEYLEANKDPIISIDIDADDLHEMTGEPLDHFGIGRLFRLALPDYGAHFEERIIERIFSQVYDEPYNVRLTLANRSQSIESDLQYLEKLVDGGVSSGTTRRSGGGVSQQTILDALIKTEEYKSDNEAWKKESGVRIEANATEIFATKQAITGGNWDDIETINAIMRVTSDNGGLAQMLVGRKNNLEEVVAGLQVAGAGGGMVTMGVHNAFVEDTGQKITDVGIRIDGANAEIALKANQTTVDALGTRVSSAEIAIDGANAEIALKVNKNGVIGAINLSSEEARIAASRIVLDGYVQMSEFEANIGDINNLLSGKTTIQLAKIGGLDITSFLTYQGTTVSWHTVDVVTDVTLHKNTGTAIVKSGLSNTNLTLTYLVSNGTYVENEVTTIKYLGVSA